MRRLVLAACAGGFLLGACTPAPQPPAPQAPVAQPVRPTATVPTDESIVPEKAAAEVAADAADWELPGTLGPLTTQLELESRFGKANVREETFDGAEGIGTYPALVVFADDPRKRLELVLDADNPDAPIRELRVANADSLWRDASGLRTGMSLEELVALNGAPVSFYGLGWDYGGTVQDWHGGKLANGVGERVFHRVTLSARVGADVASLLTGDAAFRSDDPTWAAAGKDLVVAELGLSWPNDGDE